MALKLAADLVVVVHFAFIAFVVVGGLLVLKWGRVSLLHLPCVAYAALLEFCGWICPLTPLEQHLRTAAGQAGYAGGFIDHYLVKIIYPPGLTAGMQVGLGVLVLVVNAGIYAWVIRRAVKARQVHA
mgnify:CR=1 FL=1